MHLTAGRYAEPSAEGFLQPKPRLRVLLVSEDPEFITEIQEEMLFHEVQVVACLGPAHSTCPLYEQGVCPLAEDTPVIVVDSPRSGAFVRRWEAIPAGDYAHRLAAANPDAFIVLAGAPLARAGGTGDVSHVQDRRGIVELLRWLAYLPPYKRAPYQRASNGHGR